MTLKGGTSQACAACKYQRKRCTPECALAPHFRPEQTETFKNAHKLFGVRNILRILEQVDPALKTEAMRSIIFESNMRDQHPVHGCLGGIIQLQCQIRQVEKELYSVLSQLEFYTQRSQQHEITLSPMDSHSPDESQHLQLGMGQFVLPYNANDTANEGYNSNPVAYNNTIWPGQQTYYNNENNDKVQMVKSQPMTIQEEVTHDYDEIYPFFDTIDDTQSYIDAKEANESSSESTLRETKQHVVVNKLKNAELQLGIVTEDYQAFV